MIRALVVSAFLIVALAVLLAARWVGADTSTGNVLINLGTEIFGIVITVAVVEWFFERRRLQDRARDLAWDVLHDTERVVWVWQGGPRRMGTDQLLGLISAIRSEEAMAGQTQALLQSLGERTGRILDREAAAVKSLKGLNDALSDLTSLPGLGEQARQTEVRMVAEILESCTTGIARVLGLPDQRIPSALIRNRDPGEEAQDRRYQEAYPGLDIVDGHERSRLTGGAAR